MSSTLNTRWAEGIEYFEYTSAANPKMPPIEIEAFPSSLHQIDETTAIPLDLSTQLGANYPCTGPSLLANYIHINAGEKIATSANATGQIFYCIRGSGYSETADGPVEWKKGDYFACPGFWDATRATS